MRTSGCGLCYGDKQDRNMQFYASPQWDDQWIQKLWSHGCSARRQWWNKEITDRALGVEILIELVVVQVGLDMGMQILGQHHISRSWEFYSKLSTEKIRSKQRKTCKTKYRARDKEAAGTRQKDKHSRTFLFGDHIDSWYSRVTPCTLFGHPF